MRGWELFAKNIGLKLTLAVGMTALMTISVFAYFSIRSKKKILLAEVERHANQLSEAMRSSLDFDMLHNDRERVRESIKRMGNQESIQRIRVMNKAGEIIYSSAPAEIGSMVDKKGESCYQCHSVDRPLERLDTKARTRIFRLDPNSPRTLGIITPIYNAPSCWTAACHAHPKTRLVLGVLDVTMPLAEVDRNIRQGQLGIFVFAVSSIVVLSLIIGLFVKRWVVVPVNEMLEATRHIADGDLHYMIRETRSDEMGMLARSFNNMTRRLSQARLQLFQSDKMASLGRLAAGVAHEINNPLTGVLTYSSFLLKRTKDQPEIQEDLQVIVRETLRSREIVKSLLDFARQSVPKKAEADINAIMEKAAAVVGNQLALNQVKLVRGQSQQELLATVDANQLQQVFINLFVNAADAIGPQGGTITISSSIIRLPPVGITQIKKALCPKRHSLIDNELRIGGKPSIRFKARSKNEERFVHIDTIYGKKGFSQNQDLGAEADLQFLCPTCSSSLMVEGKSCPDCKSAVYAFESPPQGMMEGCVRDDCRWQRWEAVDSAGDRDFVELKISDTGCGISKENLPNIFEPFYSTKGQKGTGLGLAVIWGIIDNHNGTIDVSSEPGAGTTFTIRIPVKA